MCSILYTWKKEYTSCSALHQTRNVKLIRATINLEYDVLAHFILCIRIKSINVMHNKLSQNMTVCSTLCIDSYCGWESNTIIMSKMNVDASQVQNPLSIDRIVFFICCI